MNQSGLVLYAHVIIRLSSINLWVVEESIGASVVYSRHYQVVLYECLSG